MRIALVEDDIDQAAVLQLWLEAAGHQPHHFATGADFCRDLGSDEYDLILLDWLLPDSSGVELLKWVRTHVEWPIPILFVTQRDSEEDIVYALENGADDYMVKPVTQMELLARITALGRRAGNHSRGSEVTAYGPYTVDKTSRQISRNGQRIDLTQKEFDLAVFLFNHLGRVLERSLILKQVWGHSTQINTRTVDTHISRIRKKLELTPKNGWKLSAVYQYGYRLEPLEQTADNSPG